MALIGKIRQHFWFVLILLGLALAAFLIMDTSLSSTSRGASDAQIGSVNGQKIDYNEFSRTEQAYFSGSTADAFAKKNTIWNYFIEKALVKEETEALGLSVSYDELMDLQFGNPPSPIITQNQWQAADLQNIRNTLTSGEPIQNPNLEAYWAEQEQQIINDALKTKMNNIISKAVYTPSWLAEESHATENTKIDFKYVKIPFDQMDASGIQVSDADIKNYVSTRKDQFMQEEETRVAEYAVFNVVPSASDSTFWLEKMNETKANFMAAANDSLFVTGNGGAYSHLYTKLDILSESNRASIESLNPGEYYGPFIESGSYVVVKMIDKKVIPDTVQAQHILRSIDPNNPASAVAAEAFIDSINTVYKRGRVSFDTLAVRHSQDPGSAVKGGDLGKFTQQTMVPEFTKAAFGYGKTGGVYKVKSQFGYHLIKVGEQIFNDRELKYNIASVVQTIIPTQETQDTKYDEVTELLSQNREAADLANALQAMPDVTMQTSAPMKINDYLFGNLGSGQTQRDMVKWAFDPSAEVGDVSDEVYRFSDPVRYYDNRYVVVTLKSIVPAGMPTADVLRSQVESVVMNKMKGEKLKSSLSVSTLDALAAQYNTTVETATDVAASSTFVAGVGSEPDVIGTAFDLTPQSVSKPILGESGLFVVEKIRTMEAGAATNIPFLKTSVSTATKSQVGFKIIENMKERANITDKRASFF
jgi:peptidyl-prolyl cis-trans isomerase D